MLCCILYLIIQFLWTAQNTCKNKVTWVYNHSFQFKHVNPLKSSGNYMYHYFNIQQLCSLHTVCTYVFYGILRINSDYFSKQHWSTDLCTGYVLSFLRGKKQISKYYWDKLLLQTVNEQTTKRESPKSHSAMY
jgi:hypothetical protein